MINWLLRKFGYEKRTLTYEDGVACGLVTGRNLAGVSINEDVALGITAVWCAVNTISNLVAGLPLSIYQHLSDGDKREAKEHPLYDLLANQVNENLTKEAFISGAMVQALLYGNSYSEIVYDKDTGRAVEMYPLCTELVTPFWDEGNLLYKVKVNGGEDIILPSCAVFHIAGLSDDGITAYSPIRTCREALSMTKAAENFGASFFGNSARPGIVLSTPNTLSAIARNNIQKSWDNQHAGSNNASKTAVLEEGLTATVVTANNEENQFLQTRNYQITEVARIFNINPMFLHNGVAAWTDIASVNKQLVQLTLMPWLNKITSQIKLKLLTKAERQQFFPEFDLTKMLRPDELTRNQAYTIATGGKPWLLPSEVRAMERLDPAPELDNPTNEVPDGAESIPQPNNNQ